MNKKTELKEFIDDNYRLIAIIGVFGGLTAYFSNIKTIELSFFCFLIFLVLSWELLNSFPEELYSMNLILFSLFLGLLILYTMIHILETYMESIIEFSFIGSLVYIQF